MDKALTICLSIVHEKNSSNGSTQQLEDECAVSTMEDIAKIYENKGDLESSISWLNSAATSEASEQHFCKPENVFDPEAHGLSPQYRRTYTYPVVTELCLRGWGRHPTHREVL